MNFNYRNSLLTAAVVALALSFGSAVYAEKGAETLVRLSRGVATAKTEAVADADHSCAKCTDTLVTAVDKSTKGPNFSTSQVAQHGCGDCATKITTEGTGKARKEVASHTCAMDVKPGCCIKK